MKRKQRSYPKTALQMFTITPLLVVNKIHSMTMRLTSVFHALKSLSRYRHSEMDYFKTYLRHIPVHLSKIQYGKQSNICSFLMKEDTLKLALGLFMQHWKAW